MTRPAVFLDRDGTMIHEAGYLSRIEDVRWYPGTMDAVRLLNRAGYLVCVVSNQGGIALGLFDDAFVETVHASMDAELRASGAVVEGWYYCPHHPHAVVEALKTPCVCRKPGRGMIDAACEAHAIDLARSWVIGDRDVDVRMARAVGARAVLVRTGHGERDLGRLQSAGDKTGGTAPEGVWVVANLMEAVAALLAQDGQGAA